MAFLKKVNCARTTINQVGGINDSATTVTVADASDFPDSGDFLITIWDANTYPDPCDDPNKEIVKVTGVSSNTFTIQRGQEDTSGHAHSNGQRVANLITAGTFEELETEINALTPGQNVYNEELTSQVDGIVTEFTTNNDFVSGTLRVYLNGIRQIPGASADFVETGSNTFEFANAPNTDTKIIIDYIKS